LFEWISALSGLSTHGFSRDCSGHWQISMFADLGVRRELHMLGDFLLACSTVLQTSRNALAASQRLPAAIQFMGLLILNSEFVLKNGQTKQAIRTLRLPESIYERRSIDARILPA
jgi:hypothetical protein